MKYLSIVWTAAFLIAIALLAAGHHKLGGLIFGVAAAAELFTLVAMRPPGKDNDD